MHYAIIHNYGSHSYQNIIVDGTAVNYGVVTNDTLFPMIVGCFISAMYSPILDINQF
jgi:hypothetical protein